ncbi:hypothetical protein, partial [Hyunsoonleella rubra]
NLLIISKMNNFFLLNHNAQRVFIIFILFTLIQSFGQSEREKELAEIEKQRTINESKFYYPKAYDDWWRMYQPKLTGAEGWITEDCEKTKYRNKKVVVTRTMLKHKSWGFYKGNLTLKLIDNSETVTVDFKCFKPDFSVGNWLSKEY